jgi:hypothetical protein
MLAMLIALSFTSPCDSLESELYKIELNLKQIRSCLCIRKSEYDDFSCAANQTLKPAKKCPELASRVDSIKAMIKQTRKELQ